MKISENNQQKCKGLYVTKRSRPPCQCFRAYLFRSERLPKAPNYYVSNYQKFRVLLCIQPEGALATTMATANENGKKGLG